MCIGEYVWFVICILYWCVHALLSQLIGVIYDGTCAGVDKRNLNAQINRYAFHINIYIYIYLRMQRRIIHLTKTWTDAHFCFKRTYHCWLDSIRWLVGIDKFGKESLGNRDRGEPPAPPGDFWTGLLLLGVKSGHRCTSHSTLLCFLR